MATTVKMPQLGESVVEGTVSRWLKAPGAVVFKREPLLEITTDKIDTEVPAPADGILLEILVGEGVTVTAGTVLATIGEHGEQAEAKHQTDAGAVADSSSGKPLDTVDGDARPTGRAFVSPVVARMAAEHSLDLDQLVGSGLGGRITKKDVEAYLLGEKTPNRESTATSSTADDRQADAVLLPLTALRRTIADHMVLSKRTSPHVTSIFEADMTAVVQHREQQKAFFAAKGVSLTFTAYFIAAVVAGLKAVPAANSRFTEDGIFVNRRIHIGMAVTIANGLIVPVLRDADEMNLLGIARAVNDLAIRARGGQLLPDEVRGGTFTVTDHGIGGSLFATPIINQPETGILGIGKISKRPVVHSQTRSLLPSADDALVIRPMVYLSFSFDHRVLDGAEADEFLTVVKERLENWKQ